MGSSKQKQLDRQSVESRSTLAKPLAPEEIRSGDSVAVLHVVCELPSFLWLADASTLPLHEPIRIQFVPEGSGTPLRVESVCLPFVLVKLPTGERHTLDVRRYRLARLDPQFATSARVAHKKSRSKRSGKHRFGWPEL
jgi:hypothetical protein